MNATPTDIRCKRCGTLLARKEADGLSIRRGEMKATVAGTDFTVSVTCYRCSTPNIATAAPARAATG